MNTENAAKISQKYGIAVKYKAAKVIMKLVGLVVICWLSYIILSISNVLCDGCHPKEVTWGGSAINYSTVVFNPLLYGLLNKNIRKVLFREYCTSCPISNEDGTPKTSHTRTMSENIVLIDCSDLRKNNSS